MKVFFFPVVFFSCKTLHGFGIRVMLTLWNALGEKILSSSILWNSLCRNYFLSLSPLLPLFQVQRENQNMWVWWLLSSGHSSSPVFLTSQYRSPTSLSVGRLSCSSCRASPTHLSRPHLRSTYLFRLWKHLSTWWSCIFTEDPLPLADLGPVLYGVPIFTGSSPFIQQRLLYIRTLCPMCLI